MTASPRRSVRSGSLFAAALVLAAVLVADVTPIHEPVILLVLPIAFAAYVGGLVPGLVATGLGAIGAVFLLISPHGSFAIADPDDLVDVAMLVVTGIVVSTLCETSARARRAAETGARRAVMSERRLAEVFQSSPVPLALTRISDQVIVDVNVAYIALLGWERGELLGRSGTELGMYPPGLHQTLLRRLRRSSVIRGQYAKLHRKDGIVLDVAIAMDVLEIDGELHALTAISDETERLHTEALLRSSDEKLRDLAAAIDEFFWLSTPSRDRMIFVSPGFEKIYGQPLQRLQEDPGAWFECIHPDDRARIAAARDSDPIGGLDNEYRIVRPDGTLRWVHSKVFPVRGARGEVVRLAGVITDITARRALEEQLLQTRKMESLGMLAGGVAHDFNNLLAVISSCNGLLAESIPPASADRELVDEIANTVTRAAALTSQLLAFSRKQITEPVVLDLNTIVDDTHKMLRRMVGEHVHIDISLDPELPPVKVDPGNLVQVVMNLAVNARDAMPDGGTLELATRACEHPTLGRAACLSVADEGTGIPPEVLARVFEPFFTTKDRGKGTGMGLAVVHGIVDQARGRIEIESRPGAGTTFRVYLPATGETIAMRGDEPIPPSSRGDETVLVVDDDEDVRRNAARVLRAHGYDVVEARDGYAAIGVLADREVDLLLTDVVMPGMDGRELAESATANRPELRVLYMSGYTDDEVVRCGVQRGDAHLIDKPFRVPALVTKVRQVLDASTRASSDQLTARCRA